MKARVSQSVSWAEFASHILCLLLKSVPGVLEVNVTHSSGRHRVAVPWSEEWRKRGRRVDAGVWRGCILCGRPLPEPNATTSHVTRATSTTGIRLTSGPAESSGSRMERERIGSECLQVKVHHPFVASCIPLSHPSCKTGQSFLALF